MASLKPAAELARNNKVRQINESPEYRAAREALLADEIELRRHIVRVAEQRRQLPPGGEVATDYRFIGENGEVGFADLFGEHDTLIVYNFMYGAKRVRPCPMCTSLLSTWDGIIPSLQQRCAIAITAGSSIERLIAFKLERGWQWLPLFSDIGSAYARDYRGLGEDGGDNAALNVFTRRDGKIRHFWGEEMDFDTADPGLDSRGAIEFDPLWHLIDTTPEGRPPEWYPTLRYYKGR